MAARTPQDNHTLVRRCALVVLTSALVALAVLSGLSNRSYQQAASANDSQISDLGSEIAVAAGPGRTVTSKTLAALGADAARAAEQVAAKQQEFAGLSAAANHEVTSDKGNGAPGKAMNALVEHRRSLAEHWNKKSLIVADDLAYSFTTSPSFDDDEIDPRFPWYVRYDGMKASTPNAYAWRVESATPALDPPLRARVVWVCRDSKGIVLAWANAVFDGGTKTFGDLDLAITAQGAEHEQTTHADNRVPELGEAGDRP
ncbi:hypothetical protein ACFOY4_01745 [Actinomadura syzygii]